MAEEPARNPLALVLSIGGVLVFLAVVAYLTLNRPPSEHISSTSQTAADSLATTIDTGPQAEPLPATVAAPETIRVAPTNPAPVIPARPTPAASDSVAPPAASDSAASQ
jgi:type II secretory pathway component PulM